MEHEEYPISIFDEQGNKIGTKPRKDIDKEKDIFRMALIFVRNNKRELWLTKIPEKKGNLWIGKYCVSAATIVREKEKPALAAARALKEELGITGKPTLYAFKERLYTMGTIKQFLSCFVTPTSQTLQPNKERNGEGQWVKISIINAMLKQHQEKFSPLFYIAWQRCKGQL